jgi:hypothetical protein
MKTQCSLKSDSGTFQQNKKVVYIKHKMISRKCTQEEGGVFLLQVSEDLLECHQWDSSVWMEGEATCQNRPHWDSSLSAMVSPAPIGKVPPVDVEPLSKDTYDLTNPKVLGVLI